ncbi:MAG: autotransporter-associated beta strand repeat-containing protein [Thermoguttaceae bacterium]
MTTRSHAAIRSVRRSRHGGSSLRSGRRLRALGFEPLEDRRLLSVVPALPVNARSYPTFKVHSLTTSDSYGTTSPVGLIPNQVRGAYGLGTYSAGSGSLNNGNYIPGSLQNGISFNSLAGLVNGDGSGQTIAIVDAYDDPNALGDLNAFSSYINGSVNFGLPTLVAAGSSGGPTFEKLNESGQPSPLPGTDPNGPGDSDWENEESLDIEWTHVMAPMANIILLEANSESNSDLYAAVQAAENLPGVVAISMSWSGAEYSSETSDDSTYFTTPAGHVGGAATVGGTGIPGGITFLAATGDSGAYADGSRRTISPQYPAASPNVVAVGGTSLTANGNSYGGETSWGNGTRSGKEGGGGGGISSYESLPQTNFQSSVVSSIYSTDNGFYSTNAPHRTYPDVSADANPNNGVAIYDSYDFGTSTPWFDGYFGGTSLATPLWAGVVAVADQGRAVSGLGSLDGKTQTLPLLYQIDSAAPASFNDITTGSSIGPTSPPPSYAPAQGWDLATGIGSPVGNLLVPRLVGIPAVTTAASASPSSVTGTTTVLSVVAAASGDASNLTYTWAATSLPTGAAAPTFSANGTNAANTTTVLFSQAGTYTFSVTIADSLTGGSTTSSTTVTVTQTLTGIAVVPISTDLGATGTQQFAATAVDQFGNVLATQPEFSWSVLGAGTVDSNGNYAPPYAAGSATVVAASGTMTGTYDVTFPGSAQWTSGSNGSWDSSSDWTGTISGAIVADPGLRGVAGDTVVFDSSSPVTVTMDGANPSIAGVVFNDSADDQVASGTGGTLQLDNGTESATITVAAGNDAVSAPVLLTSNLVVDPAAGSQLTISGGISGAGQSLTVNDQGTVVLKSANSYSGGTTVSAGTLILANSSAIATGTSLTVGADAALIFGSSVDTSASAVLRAALPAIANSANTTAVFAATTSDTSATTAVLAVTTPAFLNPLPTPSRISSHDFRTGPTGANRSLVGSSSRLPIVPPAVSQPPLSFADAAWGTPAADRFVGPLIARGIAGDLAWLWQANNGSDASDEHYKDDMMIHALDTVFAQYGR